jgi:protein PsiE
MKKINQIGHRSLVVVQDLGLLIIAIATIVAVGFEVVSMFKAGKVTLADLLLLFIYLEVLAMVVIYLESGKLPIRIPLYIAIVALARYLILDMKNLDSLQILGISGAALILALTVLTIRYGHNRYPYESSDDT